MRGAAVAGPAEDDGPGERGWADRMDEFPDDDGEEDAPYDAYDEEDGYDDDDIAAALESLDMRDDFAARGGHAGGSGGLATSAPLALGASPRSRGATERVGSLPEAGGWP